MKTLIVYYSMEGNTEYAAEKIASELGVETLRIEPLKAYPTKGFRTFVIENNLKGKRIAAFACQSGSGAEKAFGILKAAIGIEKLDAELILIDPKTKPSKENEKKIKAFCEMLEQRA